MLRVLTRLTGKLPVTASVSEKYQFAAVLLKLGNSVIKKNSGRMYFLLTERGTGASVRGEHEVENVYLPLPAGNQYARKTPWEGVFLLFPLGGFTGLEYSYDFGPSLRLWFLQGWVFRFSSLT
jgi:hypothetical protein